MDIDNCDTTDSTQQIAPFLVCIAVNPVKLSLSDTALTIFSKYYLSSAWWWSVQHAELRKMERLSFAKTLTPYRFT